MFISNMLSIVLERVNFVYSTVVSIDVKNSGITLHDVLILKNGGLGGVVTLWRSKVTFLGHTVLAQNYGYKQNSHGALYAYSSTLIFEGNVDFVNNTASSYPSLPSLLPHPVFSPFPSPLFSISLPLLWNVSSFPSLPRATCVTLPFFLQAIQR